MKDLTAPYIRGKRTTRGIMLEVIGALLPALAAGVAFHGLRALVAVMVSVAAAMLAEELFRRKTPHRDGSAAVTGLLLGMSLPPTVPYAVAATGAVFAVIVGKGLTGGLGKNSFNPALAARAFLMLAFPQTMFARFSADGVSAATPLHEMRIPRLPSASLWDLLLGRVGGCIGEGAALLLLFGGGYLLWRRIISIQIPLGYLGTVAVLALIFPCTEQPFLWMIDRLLSGGLMLGAFFMATDFVTSPTTPVGRWIYGIGCGILTYVLCNVGIYPESVTFAILLMNPTARWLDRVTAPRIFGRRKGAGA